MSATLAGTIKYQPQNEKEANMIENIQKQVEGAIEFEIRKVLNFLGVNCDVDTPMESIQSQMKILGLDIRHITVSNRPKLNGFWLMKEKEPVLILCDPKWKNGKVCIERIVM